MATNFGGKKILILGAGVTRIEMAQSLSKRGAEISLADDLVTETAGFTVAPHQIF